MSLRYWSLGLLLGALAVAGCGGGANDSPFGGGGDIDASPDVATESASDASPDAPSDTSIDAPNLCATSDDCPAASAFCQVPLCASSVCTTAPAPDGTDVPASAQKTGDCKKITCGAGGAVTTVADISDVPADDGNPCTDEVCNGPNPAHLNSAAGTACGLAPVGDASAAAGFCTGAGACGMCNPGTSDCDATTPRTCGSTGAWSSGTECPFVCTGAGLCTGSCVPGSTDCASKQRC